MVTLEKVGKISSGGTPSTETSENFNGDIPWITPADLSDFNNKVIFKGKRNISKIGLNSSSAVLIPKGSVIFSSRAPIGYVAIAGTDLSTNQGFKNISPYDGFDSEYIYYYLKSIKGLASSKASGTTFLEISKSNFSKLPIPIASLSQQINIVSKIDELFSQLDAAEAALKRARANLKRYRQSVLQAAVTGELTHEWRQSHEESSRKFITKEYIPKEIVTELNLPQIPNNWIWAKTSDVCMSISNGSTPKPSYMSQGSGDIPFIKVYNLTNSGSLDFSINPTFITNEINSKLLLRSQILPGDILMNIVGPPLGKVSLVPDNFSQWNINQAIVGFRVNQEIINKFLLYLLLSNSIQKKLQKTAKATAGQYNLNVSTCRNIIIPLPPVEEQIEIIQEVEKNLSVIQIEEEIITNSINRVNSLRRAILHEAFIGQLVKQEIH